MKAFELHLRRLISMQLVERPAPSMGPGDVPYGSCCIAELRDLMVARGSKKAIAANCSDATERAK